MMKMFPNFQWNMKIENREWTMCSATEQAPLIVVAEAIKKNLKGVAKEERVVHTDGMK